MDMNKAFYLRKEDRKPKWHLVDAEGQVLGRLATKIADLATGKRKATSAPHTGDGDYVVVVNAEKVKLTGDKLKQKVYQRYTGWHGNRKEFTAQEVLATHPTRLIEHAVDGMLPKNTLGREAQRRVLIYKGNEHPHAAQFGKIA